jgi:hypothetical protein
MYFDAKLRNYTKKKNDKETNIQKNKFVPKMKNTLPSYPFPVNTSGVALG